MKRFGKSLFNSVQKQQKKFFSLHEYQSHQVFEKFGITTPKGGVATTVAEAEAIAEKINSTVIILLIVNFFV